MAWEAILRIPSSTLKALESYSRALSWYSTGSYLYFENIFMGKIKCGED
jgi:hypothetical protein